jgi:hypothetical protein
VAGLGKKTFTAGEVLTASDVNGYLMDQAVMVFGGTAARSSAIPSPSEGMMSYRTDDDVVEVYDGTDYVAVGGAQYGVATGGTATSITDGGVAYTLLTFTASGTLTVTKAGLFDVLIQAASGAGGSTTTTLHSSGGAGGGSVTIATVYLDANQTITLGAGGVAVSGAPGTTGGKTSLGSILYGIPGAGGPSRSAVVKDGGCGAGTSNGNDAFGNFTAGVGFVGGNGGVSTQDAANGGAGGGAGGNASGTTAGVGITSTFTGSSVTYGTGGGVSGGTAGNANGSGGSGRNNASSGLGGAGSNAKVFVRFK